PKVNPCLLKQGSRKRQFALCPKGNGTEPGIYPSAAPDKGLIISHLVARTRVEDYRRYQIEVDSSHIVFVRRCRDLRHPNPFSKPRFGKIDLPFFDCFFSRLLNDVLFKKIVVVK